MTQVKAFIGMVNYYGKFVSNLIDILAPLYEISKSCTEFSWSGECNKAFEKANNIIASEKILVHFDPSQKIMLTCMLQILD